MEVTAECLRVNMLTTLHGKFPSPSLRSATFPWLFLSLFFPEIKLEDILEGEGKETLTICKLEKLNLTGPLKKKKKLKVFCVFSLSGGHAPISATNGLWNSEKEAVNLKVKVRWQGWLLLHSHPYNCHFYTNHPLSILGCKKKKKNTNSSWRFKCRRPQAGNQFLWNWLCTRIFILKI